MNAFEEYTTVRAADSKELDSRVTELLKKGFELYGSPYIATGPDGVSLFQALVRGKAGRVFSGFG